MLDQLPADLRQQVLLFASEGGTDATALLRIGRTCRWMREAAWAAIRCVKIDSALLEEHFGEKSREAAAQADGTSEQGQRAPLAGAALRTAAAYYARLASQQPWQLHVTMTGVLSRCEHVQTIDLGFGGAWGDASLAALGMRSDLRTVRARDATVDASDCALLAAVGDRLPALTDLDLSSNDNIGGCGFDALQGVLCRIVRLGLADCGISFRAAAEFTAVLPCCTRLDLR
jgi:hypothetical protein